NPATQMYVIERIVTHITLNGYSTTSPLGKRASDIQSAIYMSAVREPFRKRIDDIIDRRFNTHTVTVRSFPLAFFKAVNQVFIHGTSYLLFDITGESTELSIIRDGALHTLISVPMGKNTLVRSVMQHYGVNAEIALSFLNLLFNKSADTSFDADLRQI